MYAYRRRVGHNAEGYAAVRKNRSYPTHVMCVRHIYMNGVRINYPRPRANAARKFAVVIDRRSNTLFRLRSLSQDFGATRPGATKNNPTSCDHDTVIYAPTNGCRWWGGVTGTLACMCGRTKRHVAGGAVPSDERIHI